MAAGVMTMDPVQVQKIKPNSPDSYPDILVPLFRYVGCVRTRVG